MHASLLLLLLPLLGLLRLSSCLKQPHSIFLAPAADRASQCPYTILLQHHCPLPPQLRREQQQRRREQDAAAAVAPAPAAAAAAPLAAPARLVGRAALAPLPSQGTLLARVRQQQQQGAGQAGAALSADELMDELFALEQRKQHERPAAEAGPRQQPPQPPLLQQAQAQQQVQGQAQQVQQQAAAKPTADQLLDELAALEQHAAQAPQQGPQPAALPHAAAASAGASEGAMPPTQPAPQAASPASLASCFVPHKRVVAFVWAAVRSIVPAALLGDPRNRRVLRGAIR